MAIKTYNITAADAAYPVVMPLSRYVAVVRSTTKGGTVIIKASSRLMLLMGVIDGS